MNKGKNILICPLEWGLGHAARMIPLAKELLNRGHNVIIASGKDQLNLIQFELPGCRQIIFPGFKPVYSRYLPQYLAVLLQIPLLIYYVVLEHIRLKGIIRENSIDIVISDNRFGLWNSKVKTVYITHQLKIPFPKGFRFLEGTGAWLHRLIIRNFDYCFIPDLPGETNLSGRLSHNTTLPGNERYIGILSRFSDIKEMPDQAVTDREYKLVILSGPEPQRSIIQEKLEDIFAGRNEMIYFLEGKPGNKEQRIAKKNMIFFSHMTSAEMARLIRGASSIICRSGYSTIMDLVSTGSSAILVPTPGQTEQEYLSEYLYEKDMFRYISQKELNSHSINIKPNTQGYLEMISDSRILLEKALNELLQHPH